MPEVSVLLVTWNRPELFQEAIDSVFAQTYEDWELIILDDNSVDPAKLDLLRRYWSDPRVRLYKDNVQDPDRRRNKTRCAVLINIGIQLARGKYVTYLCDDDYFLPPRLELMVKRLDQGDCQVVYGSQYAEYLGRPETRWVRLDASQVLASAYCCVDISEVMHTRQAALDVGGWDEDIRHFRIPDAVFWNRLTNAGHLFYPVPEFTEVHRYWADSETGLPQ